MEAANLGVSGKRVETFSVGWMATILFDRMRFNGPSDGTSVSGCANNFGRVYGASLTYKF